MTIVTDLFNILGDIIVNFVNVISEAVNGVVSIFYDEGFTFVGTLLLVGLGMSLAFWGFRFIRNLIRR